jgi:DnaK suppressor protein
MVSTQEKTMNHLTAGQRALLQSELQSRQKQLDVRLAAHHGGVSRVDHAHELLEQDGDDAPQRDNARELDLALSDLETQELGAVSQALLRLQEGQYGSCVGCDADIAFDRLRAQPWALRCVACQAAHENQTGVPAG